MPLVNLKNLFNKNKNVRNPISPYNQDLPSSNRYTNSLDLSSNIVDVNITLNKVDISSHAQKDKIVIIYTYFKSPVADYNLTFFSRRELTYKENIDYVIVINGYTCDILFPRIANLTILKRENVGYDFGGHNEAIQYLKSKGLTYKYYFFMNSGVFGPIMPAYITEHWSEIFIKKLIGLVKIVGTSIVCLRKDDLGGFGPKVEGFFFLTDSIGLGLLLEEETVFCNHVDKKAAIIDGEYGLTKCIMKHGYTIDCMIQRYNGVDWYDKRNWNINNNKHPTRKNDYFGKSINPYEVIFHKWYWEGKDLVNYDIVKHYVEQTVLA